MVVAEPVDDPPEVDHLDTRRLERNEVVRTHVKEATLLEQGPAWVLLRTNAGATRRFSRFGDEVDLASGLPETGEVLEGRLRIDVVGDGVVRVRYAEGDEIPANETPMVIGEPTAPGPVEVAADERRATLVGGGVRVEVTLKPLAIDVTSAEGRQLCRVGGREKNQWNLWDTFNTGICRTAEGRPLAVECFALRPQEAVYGFGEQFIGLDKVGQTIDVNMVEATGTTTPRSYKNIPFFVTTGGYGVFFNHSCRMTAWVGSSGAADVQLALEDDFLDYYVLAGDIEQVLSRYTDLTGKSHVPPAWTFGWWQSKISYRSAEETLEVVHRMREERIPLDVLHLDTHWFREDWRCDLEFDPERFPDPEGYLAEMASLGVHVSLWQLPYIPEGSTLFDELAAVGGFVRDRSGGIYDVGICYTPGWKGVVGCIDFTNPAGVAVYQRHLRRLLEAGAAAIKVDFGEQAPLDGVYHDGSAGHRAHNLYPLLYNRAVAEVTAEVRGEWIIWARSAWAGSQRYPLHWGGDSSPNWDNLGPQIAGGLSFGLSGFPFWSQDIGGFLGATGGELLVRWVQAGVFLSHCRIHGAGTRELYRFPDDVRDRCADYVRLRYRLLPYLLGTAADSVSRSIPMARPLVVAFPDDPSTWRIADQWLLGDDLLVAPVLDPSGRRRVYLPAGTGWSDWWTGARHEGGRWIEVEADLDTIPLYLRDGGLVPLGPELQYVGERPTDELLVRVAPLRSDGECRFVAVADGDAVPIRYERRGSAHVVSIPADGPTVRLEPVAALDGTIDIATT